MIQRKIRRLLLLALSFSLTAGIHAADLGYDTAYYYDLYGSQVADKEPHYLFFPVQWRGKTSPRVPGPYKSKTYKDGKLTAIVHFRRPELRAVAVEYILPHAWTTDQVKAALEIYGKSWSASEKIETNPFWSLLRQNVWFNEEGTLAHYSPHMKRLTILSTEILSEFDRIMGLQDKKREEVPKF